MPVIGTFAPAMTTFRKGRDFAAWLGLVPKQHSSGGKQVLGRTSKMGQRDIRRLLIIGAMTVIRWASRKAPSENTWLAGVAMVHSGGAEMLYMLRRSAFGLHRHRFDREAMPFFVNAARKRHSPQMQLI